MNPENADGSVRVDKDKSKRARRRRKYGRNKKNSTVADAEAVETVEDAQSPTVVSLSNSTDAQPFAVVSLSNNANIQPFAVVSLSNTTDAQPSALVSLSNANSSSSSKGAVPKIAHNKEQISDFQLLLRDVKNVQSALKQKSQQLQQHTARTINNKKNIRKNDAQAATQMKRLVKQQKSSTEEQKKKVQQPKPSQQQKVQPHKMTEQTEQRTEKQQKSSSPKPMGIPARFLAKKQTTSTTETATCSTHTTPDDGLTFEIATDFRTHAELAGVIHSLAQLLQQLSRMDILNKRHITEFLANDKQVCERILKLKPELPVIPNSVANAATQSSVHQNALASEVHPSSQQETQSSNARQAQQQPNGKSYAAIDAIAVDVVKTKAFEEYVNRILIESVGKNKGHSKRLRFVADEDDVDTYASMLQDANIGRIVESVLRINRNNWVQSFVSITNRNVGLSDACIFQPAGRQYGLDGDLVRAFVFFTKATGSEASKGSSLDSLYLQQLFTQPNERNIDMDYSVLFSGSPKAFVVRILTKVNRHVIGIINFKQLIGANNVGNPGYYQFRPYDLRAPRLLIPASLSQRFVNALCKNGTGDFISKCVYRFHNASGTAFGDLVESMGPAGKLRTETRAIMVKNQLQDMVPFEQSIESMYGNEQIPKKELEDRLDLRQSLVFTIDPLTARDLDDALSLERFSENVWQVGVHISDVSFYLQENSELDNIVKKRATSVYLIDQVVHMLPQSLCMQCSLLPGKDKLAFSVFFLFNKEGERIAQPYCTRTIINSSCQLAYSHAQMLIDEPYAVHNTELFPEIHNGYNLADIEWRIQKIHFFAQILRQQRYERGALSIDNPKVSFTLDASTGEPMGFQIEERNTANFMIEEFMLLSNQAVARCIMEHFPESSVLRIHSPPTAKLLLALEKRLHDFGYKINHGSSKELQESMTRLIHETKEQPGMKVWLNNMLTKPMARAKYVCSDDHRRFYHYALAVSLYTHFTSPIRRYPDILVHRLLAAAFEYAEPMQRSAEELSGILKICNDQKWNAKNASDDLTLFYFKRLVQQRPKYICSAVLLEVSRNTAFMITLKSGFKVLICYKSQNKTYIEPEPPKRLKVYQKITNLLLNTIDISGVLEIELYVHDDKLCGNFLAPNLPPKKFQPYEGHDKGSRKTQLVGAPTPSTSKYANVAKNKMKQPPKSKKKPKNDKREPDNKRK